MTITPSVASITDAARLHVMGSLRSTRAKMTMNAGVPDVMTAPICAVDHCVPTNCAQMESA